ncbi:MAG: 23S rRNA (guanosine(2251)-2'-O)-methyltransferase RlmB [Clostridiaceae bacterium]|nr:23S rRNA (guanosine(2251)-2'-O)-methyltransferase RlmB [Clostridiaceae bacterium]
MSEKGTGTGGRRGSGDGRNRSRRTERGFSSGREQSERRSERGSEHASEFNELERNEGREDRLEGRRPIQEALRAGRTIDKLWVPEQLFRNPRGSLYEIIMAVKESGGLVIPVSDETFRGMTETSAPQGVIAQVAARGYVEVDDILAAAEAAGEPPFILILDEVQDPRNLGSILRIAEAAGVHGIIIPRHRQVTLTTAVASASAGAIEYVPCARVTNISRTIECLQERGVWVTGTAPEAETDYTEHDFTGPLAIVIGNEASGISRLVRERCDFLVRIPMQGRLNSLNAAVAGGIVVFEALRQRLSRE